MHPLSSHAPSFRTITMLGSSIFAEKRVVWRQWLEGVLVGQQAVGEPKLVFTPNAEQLVQAYESASFQHDLQQADVLLPDGVGPLLVSYWQDRQHPIAERLAGADAIKDVLWLAADNNLSVLVVGGRDYGVVNQLGYGMVPVPLDVAKTVKVAWLPGYIDVAHPTPTEHATVRTVINHLKPAIVLVAFGAPWQEAWSVRQQELLTSVNTRLVMVVGGALDFLLGKVSRAPLFMRRFGLEWLFRLVRQPWRWWRQLRLLKFLQLLITGAFSKPVGHQQNTQPKSNWKD